MRLADVNAMSINQNERIQIFIDGSNLYHGLKNDCRNTKLDYTEFAKVLCRNRRLIRINYYIGTLDGQKDRTGASNQQRFLGKMRQVPYVTVKQRPLTYKKGIPVEKGVDILIATDMLTGALRNCYDTVVLVSGDGDFAPVLEEIKREGKQI